MDSRPWRELKPQIRQAMPCLKRRAPARELDLWLRHPPYLECGDLSPLFYRSRAVKSAFSTVGSWFEFFLRVLCVFVVNSCPQLDSPRKHGEHGERKTLQIRP